MTENEAVNAADASDQPKGLIGRVFGRGGKSFKRAKMGSELKMYYNEEVCYDLMDGIRCRFLNFDEMMQCLALLV